MGGGSVNGSQEIENVTCIVAEPSRVYQQMPLILRGCPDHLWRRQVLKYSNPERMGVSCQTIRETIILAQFRKM